MLMKKYEFWVLSFLFLVFSFWLMFSTFSYASGQFRIDSKLWSDFGAAIPLIRSFSQGVNWPPEHPLFPGSPIKYHYLFYLATGSLEKLGVRLDIAFNLLSSLGFFLMLVFLYRLSESMFGKKAASIAVLFLLFNSSFSFVDYFSEQGFSKASLFSIPKQTQFASFFPWKQSEVAAFWNLNIYTNQRHLAFSYALVLLIIYLNYSRSRYLLFTGPLLALLASTNQAGLLIALVYLFFIGIQNRWLWKTYLLSAFLGLPFLYPYLFMSHANPQVSFNPGFIATHPLRFWFFNLGLNIFLIPLGFLSATKKQRSLVLGTIVVFLLANLYQFSPDMFNNHKLINFAVIIGGIFTANILTKLRPIILFPVFTILILGGIFDLFPILNDHKLTLPDGTNPDVQFYSSLPRGSVVLNSTWFYHPASLSGLPIFNGYSYFTWSYGYNQRAREEVTKDIYASETKEEACKKLISNHISYVELNPNHEGFLAPNYGLWTNEFAKVYTNSQTGTTVYSTDASCPN